MIRWLLPATLIGLVAVAIFLFLSNGPRVHNKEPDTSAIEIEANSGSGTSSPPNVASTDAAVIGEGSQTQRVVASASRLLVAITGPIEPAANIEVAILPWTPETERVIRTLGGLSRSLADRLARRTQANDNGHVEIQVSELPCFVAAASPALAPNGILLEDPATETPVTLECPPACSVTGSATVLGIGAQAGIRVIARSGASADWYYGSADSPSRVAAMLFHQEGSTSHDGSFTVHGLPTGNVYLHIDDPRYSSEGFYFDCSSQREDIALIARPGATIRGHVVTSDGAPVEGAWINATELLGPFEEDQMDVSISDELGAFEVRTRAGRKTYVRVMHHVEASASAPVGALFPGEIREIEIHLPGRSSIQGRVTNDVGDPAPSLVVAYDPTTGQFLDVTSTDADGVFSLTRLETGREYTLHAHPKAGACVARFGPVLAGTVDVRMEALRVGSVIGQISGAMPAFDGVLVRALLLGPDGARSEEQSTYAMADGSYVIPRVYPGIFRIDAIGDGLAMATATGVRIEPGATVQVDLALEAGVRFQGTVVDKNTRQPIQGARVTLGDHDADERIVGTLGDPVSTDATGSFELRNVSSSERTVVRIDAPGYATEDIRVRAGPMSEIALSRAASLRIVLESAPGTIAYGVRVDLIPTGQAERTLENSFSGELRVEGLPPGQVEIYARRFDDNLDVAYQRLELVAGQHHEAILRLGGACRLSVTVDPTLSDTDNPRWSLTTWLVEDTAQQWQRYFQGLDGKQHGLPAGRAIVQLTSVGDDKPLDLRQEVQLVLGQTPVVHFTNTGITLGGKITDGRDAPIPGGTAYAYGPKVGAKSGTPRIARTSHDGEYQFPDLQPGKYEIIARAPGFADESRQLDLSRHSIGDEVRQDLTLIPEVVVDVVCRADGEPCAGAFVYVAVRRDDAWEWLTSKTADDEGKIRLQHIVAGRLRILAKHEGRFTEITDLETRPGDNKSVTFDLEPARDLTVRVTDRRGEPVAGVLVTLSADGFSGDSASWFEERRVKTSTETLQTDGAGVIELRRVPASELEIWVGNIVQAVPAGETEVSVTLR